jgi:hypothetical protein
VGQYTSRSLTKSSDKLPALSGLIATLQQMGGDTCFVKSLLWEAANIEPGKAYTKRPNQWRAPSWSFASIEGCIQYPYTYTWNVLSDDYILSRVEECNVVPLDLNNPLGELKSVSEIWEHVHFR